MKAPQFLFYTYSDIEAKTLSKKDRKIFDKIINLIERLEPQEQINKERRWKFFFITKRGTYTEYKNAWRGGEPFTKDEFYQYYSDEYYWFPVYVMIDDRVKFLRVNNIKFCIVEDEKSNESDEDFFDRYYSCLKGILEELEKVVRQVEEGTYNEYVRKNLPFDERYGIINRKDYFEVKKEEKEEIYKDLTRNELDEIIDIIEKEGDKYIPNNRMTDMTFNKYFQMAIDCYKAIGKDVSKFKSKAEMFMCYAEDYGGNVLLDFDYDSTKDFEGYYTGELQFGGGHPWGILRGSSRTRIMLYPEKDKDGYYFRFSANPNWMLYETVKFYLALKHAGYPVTFSCGKELIHYIKEDDLIGFVPHYVFPAYCNGNFQEDVYDFRHFDNETDMPLLDKIKWNEIKELKIKR